MLKGSFDWFRYSDTRPKAQATPLSRTDNWRGIKRLKTCHCDDCTQNGVRKEGALQTISTFGLHKARQKARNRQSTAVSSAMCLKNLERATILETLNPDPEILENSLWRGVSASSLAHSENVDFSFMGQRLVNIHERLKIQIASFELPSTLSFRFPPQTPTCMLPGFASDNWCEGSLAIRSEASENGSILPHIDALLDMKEECIRERYTGGASIIEAIRRESDRLHTFRAAEWRRQQRLTADPCGLRTPVGKHIFYNSSIYLNDVPKYNPVVSACLFFVITLKLIFRLNQVACRAALKMLKVILKFAFGQVGGDPLSTQYEDILDSVPSDIATACKRFNLDPEVCTYACCPACFALYQMASEDLPAQDADADLVQTSVEATITDDLGDGSTSSNGSNHHMPKTEASRYPMHCTHCDPPGSLPCGAILLRRRKLDEETQNESKRRNQDKSGVYRPIRVYTYQTLKSWVARMLSRPSIERAMDRRAGCQDVHSPADRIDDILDAPEIREFIWRDGRPFLDAPASEGRYIFGLFVDWFHPHGNRKASKAKSSGIIFMACLNLPMNIRYKRENVYLCGVMPGPKAPSLEQLNHLLRPLVDELLEFWISGVYIARTALYRDGRLTSCAVIPLIGDLAAIKKAAGQASFGSTWFCSFCKLQLHAINSLYRTSWGLRTCEQHRRHAEQWKAAGRKEREDLFKQHGTRYSELLRLPYWKPSRFIVLDIMHNLFLGLMQRHCRTFFGMDEGLPSRILDDEDGTVAAKVVSEEDFMKGAQYLRTAGSIKQLKEKFKLSVLQALYDSAGLGSPGKQTKSQLAEALLNWRNDADVDKSLRYSDVRQEPSAQCRRRPLLGREVLQEVKKDMVRTSMPTWLGRVPIEVGSSRAGTLTTDQWRTFCLVHLPITLIRLWSSSRASRKLVLENYVQLVIAVIHGAAREASSRSIDIYDSYIFKYAHGLRTLFPDINLYPNNHFALHLGEILRRFGPPHGYSAYPFERYIRIVRNANTSQRDGEMETTFLRAFCMANNLKAMFSARLLPDVFRQFSELIEDTFAIGMRDLVAQNSLTFGSDAESQLKIEDEKVKPLSQAIYVALLDYFHVNSIPYRPYHAVQAPGMVLNVTAQSLRSISIRGRRFCPARYDHGDCNIVVRKQDGANTDVSMAQIKDLFIHGRADTGGHFHEQTFTAVTYYAKLNDSDMRKDFYHKYPELNARLLYAEPSPWIWIIPVEEIAAHFVLCPYDSSEILKPCIVALIMDQ